MATGAENLRAAFLSLSKYQDDIDDRIRECRQNAQKAGGNEDRQYWNKRAQYWQKVEKDIDKVIDILTDIDE